MGRTPVPVAESTCQLEGNVLTPQEALEGEEMDYEQVPVESSQDSTGMGEKGRDIQETREPEWALPKPTEPRELPGRKGPRQNYR